MSCVREKLKRTCDEICKYNGMFDDPDDLIHMCCDKCPVLEMVEEAEEMDEIQNEDREYR